MNRFVFVAATLALGAVAQFFCQRYLSLSNAVPDVFLLLTAAHGFACGPMMGQMLGFFWGMIGDSTGTEAFGLSAFNLTAVGFMAGVLRRRVASERVTAQLVIGLVATLAQAILALALLSVFDSAMRIRLLDVIVESVMNVVFVPWVFLATERWLDVWSVEREHV